MEFLKLFVRQNPNADYARAELREMMDWVLGEFVVPEPIRNHDLPGGNEQEVTLEQVTDESDAIIRRLMNAE